MKHRHFAQILLPLLLMLALALPAAAQSPTSEPEKQGQSPLLGLLATALNMTPAQVEGYKTQVGFGGLVKASRLAQASGQSLDALIARHAAGEGWGEIAKSLGLHPGNKGNNLGQLIKQQRAKEKDKTPPGQDKDKQKDKTPPGQDSDRTPPGLEKQGKTPPGHAKTKTPPGQNKQKQKQKQPKGDDSSDSDEED